MKVLRGIGTSFITLGLIILLFVVYELVGTSAVTRGRQSALQADFESALTEPLVEPGPLPPPFVGSLPIPASTPVAKRSRVPGIARLRIPTIGVNVIVVEGVSLPRLAYGPGHYPDTADLGAKGSSGIAGHRTGWGAPFFHLDRLGPGDAVIVETRRATYTYRVVRSIVVNPEDSWVLDGNPNSKAGSQLVLTTCTPKFTARDRLIVWADLVKTAPRG